MPRVALTSVELDSMRSRLCAAALEIFRHRGLEAVTFRSLADAVGVSHTLPYRYFEHKEGLLAGVRLLCFELFETYVLERELPRGAPLQRVLSVADAYASFVADHPVEYTLIFSMNQPPPIRYPALLAARKRLFEHAVSLAQQCIDDGCVIGDAREITHAVWASLHGLLSLHVANQLVHGQTLDALVRPTICRILGVAVPRRTSIAGGAGRRN